MQRMKKSRNSGRRPGSRARQAEVLKAFLSGQVIPLEDVPDDVFSQHIMGDGLAIEPADDTVVAPADATVSVVMEDSRHACGLDAGQRHGASDPCGN